MTKKRAKLPVKRELFCQEYAVDFNATQAAIRAGYSKKTANAAAGRLLLDVIIQARIGEVLAERVERTQVDADYILKRLFAEAEADLADIYTSDGSLKPIHDWPKIWRQGLIAGVDVQQLHEYEGGQKIPAGVVIKAKVADRAKRLEMLGKHINVQAFSEKSELAVTGEIVQTNTNQFADDVYQAMVEKARAERSTSEVH